MKNKYTPRDNSLIFVDTADFLEALRYYSDGELSPLLRLEADFHPNGRILLNPTGTAELLLSLSELGGGVALVKIRATVTDGALALDVRTDGHKPSLGAISAVIRASRDAGLDALVTDEAIILKTKSFGQEYSTVYAQSIISHELRTVIDEHIKRNLSK